MSELRWNAHLGEWTITSSVRMERTYHPPPGFCPLCPTRPGEFETEIPAPDFDLVVFENRFPSLFHPPLEPAVPGTPLSPVLPSHGRCEVVVYTPVHSGSFGDLPLEQIFKLALVWQDRYQELGRLDFIDYVFIFENRGREVGVTLDHPHGQIYAFPYLPPVPARELEVARAYHEQTGGCLQCALLAEELADPRRLVLANDHFAAYVPFAARYPYETAFVARECLPSLAEMGRAELWSLAQGLKALAQGYDRLFDLPLPYMMMFHQAPTDGRTWPGAHFHVEFHPLQRSADKLKYRASVESGAGSFINDSLPEEKAAELREKIPL
ncbi:MAG: galactose-1-phosphate uridylyltransferase [candidate division WS1 bacterium]|nr:galactose-1-phosphate uridylyltransferase [candidate division WS1 bacterium]